MKHDNEAQGQLALNKVEIRLSPPEKPPEKVSGVVVGFVDASTRAVREAAIRRVKASGIFPAPRDKR